MKNVLQNVKRIVWGVVLIALGALWILDACAVIEFDLFFDGWWTLFIVVPSLIGLFTDRDKLGSLFGITLGVLLYFVCIGVLTSAMFWRILGAAVVILIGLRLIFGNLFAAKKDKAFKKAKLKISETHGEIKEYCAIFSSQNLSFDGDDFRGAELSAVFGSIECDLRNAVMTDDVVIEVSSVFGGVKILLPENARVSVSVAQVFGGVSDHRSEGEYERNVTVHVSGSCVFGGVDIQ